MTYEALKTRLSALETAVQNRIAAGKKCTDSQWNRLDSLKYDILDASANALERNDEELNDLIVSKLEEPCDTLRNVIEENM